MEVLTNAANTKDWLQATKGIAISAHVEPQFLVAIEKQRRPAKASRAHALLRAHRGSKLDQAVMAQRDEEPSRPYQDFVEELRRDGKL